ncbi:MAG: transposase [Thermodesulfobacteriota bacterium]|nr:transposase [Thermodesulfobacteriota bacterium]
MSDSNELPQKCLECAKSKTSKPHDNCHICNELEFQEAILCDLNRCIQDKADFQCHAFRQGLRLVDTAEKEVLGQDGSFREASEREFSKNLLHSDKVKYARALALQKLSRDPDAVIVELKYHFVWNVSHRTPLFVPANDFIACVRDAFLKCSEAAGGVVYPMYLAADHVHVYVESDGERSLDDMAHDIKTVSAKAVVEEFSSFQDRLGNGVEVWDEAYFVETVG